MTAYVIDDEAQQLHRQSLSHCFVDPAEAPDLDSRDLEDIVFNLEIPSVSADDKATRIRYHRQWVIPGGQAPGRWEGRCRD